MTGQPQLEVLAPGAHAALQDAGRHGLRRVGVPWAGALDQIGRASCRERV